MSDHMQALAQAYADSQALEVESPLPPEEEQRLVDKLKREVDNFKSAVAPLHKKIDRWHELYEAKRKERKNWPWPGASNYSVPLAMSTVDAVHARLMKAVFEVDPLWLARARTPAHHEFSKKAEWYLDTWADNMRLEQALDIASHNMLIEGPGIVKVDWARETRRIPTPRDQAAGQGLPNEVVEYEGPRAYPVPTKDFVLIPADAPTIEDAVYVGHRVFLTQQQLEDRRRRGIYFNVGKLLEKGQDSTHDKANHPSGLLATRSDSGTSSPETRQFEVIELFGPYEFDPEIGPEPALFTFSAEHSILLRIEPYPYGYGRAPYIKFEIFPRPNFFWPRSMVEMLESPQEELTTLHNLRADAIARQIAPPIMRRFGSRWDPEKQPWAPGQVIDVNDPAEIVELALSPVPQAAFAHAQDVLANTERMTGMSDVFMGRVSSPYQTATATTTARTEGLVRIDISISRFQESMKTLAWVLWWLLYQYRPAVDTFTANETDYQITKAEMAPGMNGLMPVEFIPQGMQSDASKEARRQQLIFLLNTAAGPLSQFYPDGLQKLLYEVFGAFDIKNKGEILGPSWNLLQQQIQMAMQQGYQAGLQAAQQVQA